MNQNIMASPTVCTCPSCGQQIPSNASFCQFCGNSTVPDRKAIMKKSRNGKTAAVFMVISAIITILLFIISLMDKNTPLIQSILLSPVFGIFIGGIIPGFLHIGNVFKKIKSLLYIPAFGWMLFLCLIIGVPYCGGWIFMLYDFFSYRKEKKQIKAISETSGM